MEEYLRDYVKATKAGIKNRVENYLYSKRTGRKW